MSFSFSVKKKKSCLGILFTLALYSIVLLLIYEYATNVDFRQNVNTGVTGVISRTGEYFSSLKEEDGTEFTLGGLWAAVSGSDIDDKTPAGNFLSGHTTDTKPTPTAKPTATKKPTSTQKNASSSYSASNTCSTRDQMVSTLKEKTENKPSSVTLELSNFLYLRADDADWVTEVIYDAGIVGASWSRRSSAWGYSITFTELEYSDAVPCTTLAQFESLLKGAKGKKSISIRPSSALYEQLMEDDCALVYATEGKLGITDSSFSYYKEPYRVLEFTDLVFEPNFHQITSLDQAKQLLYESSTRGDTSIAFYCDDAALYRELTENNSTYNTTAISAIHENCGISNGNFFFSKDKKLIYSTELEYYPGARIVMLAKTGQLNQLTSRERALYDRALSMANRCRIISNDDYELIMNICADLAGSSEYLYCESDSCLDSCDRDNAYGVLMEGGGECDSYTDAFYLVASLAGLDVGYQKGYANEEFDDLPSDTAHVWNTVTLGNYTYFLDLTWADADSSECQLNPYWILTGRDMAAHTHIWNEKTALKPISAHTSKVYFPYYHDNAAFGTLSDAREYIRSNKNNGRSYVQLMLLNQGDTSNEALLQQLFSGLMLGGSYSYRFIDKYIFLTYFY